MGTPNALDEVFHAKLRTREARAEFLTSLLFGGSLFLAFLVQMLLGDVRHMAMFSAVRLLFLCFATLTLTLAVLAFRGHWHPAVSFLNTGLQTVFLTGFLVIASEDRGPGFALTTAAPMFFVLIVCMTAFRMNPWLSAFAGIATSLALVVAYFAWLAPHLTEEMLQTNPALAAPAVLSRAIVLLTAGAACAIASSAMRRHLAATEKDKTRIELMERTFGRLLAPEVARRILENDDWMKPERRDAVVMFADLQGFTKYSETKDPEDIAEYLNVCWGKAAEIVESHGGVINKYLGDGFLALFGVPVPLEDPESAAAHTATALQEALTPLLEKEGLGLCIGIHAGPLIFGGIGSENRCEFTVVGTTVNVASRVESLNRTLETRNLTTSVVADKLGEKWSLSPRGDHRVKGIGSAFGVFELGSAKGKGAGEKT